MNFTKRKVFLISPLLKIYDGTDFSSSELIDEAIFGEELMLFCPRGEYAIVESCAGVRGYSKSSGLSFYRASGESWRVKTRFADFNTRADFSGRPVMSVPRSSEIRGILQGEAVITEICERKLFVRASQLEQKKPVFCDEDKLRRLVIKSALMYLGTPYRWGGRSTFGTDCSGLVFSACRENGIRMERNSADMKKATLSISKENLLPADLIFFEGHVGIYLGDGAFLHAGGKEGKVTVGNIEPKDPRYSRVPLSFGKLPLKNNSSI